MGAKLMVVISKLILSFSPVNQTQKTEDQITQILEAWNTQEEVVSVQEEDVTLTEVDTASFIKEIGMVDDEATLLDVFLESEIMGIDVEVIFILVEGHHPLDVCTDMVKVQCAHHLETDR